jgi:hypothetical protein
MPHPDFKPLSLMSAHPATANADPWTPLPWADVPRYDARSVVSHWPRLHAGHELPVPDENSALADGWALYHSGEFERAATLGLLQVRQAWRWPTRPPPSTPTTWSRARPCGSRCSAR